MHFLSDSSDRHRGEPHIFLEPNRIYVSKPEHPGGFPPTYYHFGEEAPSLKRQVDETIIGIESKELGDESAYYVLDMRISSGHPIVSRIIKKLNAEVLAELDENQILVTSSLSDLKAAKPSILGLKTIKNNLFSIHQLRLKDIIDPELKTGSLEYIEPKTLTFHLVPNIGARKARNYASQISDYLKSINVPIQTQWINSETGDSLLSAQVTRSQLFNLIKKSSFIFKVHERITIHTIKPMTQEVSPKDIQVEETDEDQIENMPKICIVDTGVNQIPELRGLIIDRVAEAPITTLDDLNNHGTLVASLAVYGDTITYRFTSLTPLARVISHKVKSPTHSAEISSSLSHAINLNPDCKTFSCSLCFEGTRLAFRLTTERINKIAQASNRAVVFSAGNIDCDDLDSIISAGVRYPDYLAEAPVSHPSDAPFVFSVGACTKHGLPTSFAPADAPSPFTRFGTTLRELKECPKPELVEHGGNLCYEENEWKCSGVGVKTFSNTGNIVEQIGTSLAAPLVAQHIARIWNHFGSRIGNVETVKAILLSTCKPTLNHPRYVGFGEPSEDELFFSKQGVARIVFEGSLPLTGTARGTRVIPADEIKVFVPADIGKIEIFLVHSDNYRFNTLPRLNTLINILAEKPGKMGSVKPRFGRPSSQTHVKYLLYEYKRNIKGDWFFRFLPAGIRMPAREREDVMIRYGGVIKMTAKKPRSGVSQSVVRGLERGRIIQIPLTFSK